MKKFYCFLAVLCNLLSMMADAQKMQYTRQPAVMNYGDAVQLVANISDHHHLLFFSPKRKPSILVYDQQLKLESQRVVDYIMPAVCEIKIIPAARCYYLFTLVPKSSRYGLWKIDGDGNMTSLTDAFVKLIHSQFKKDTGNFQLTAINDRLFITTHTFFRDIAKISTTVVEADSMLTPVDTKRVFYNFSQAETLVQIMLLGGRDLLVLKNAARPEEESILELMKINLNSGHTITMTFTAGQYLYTNSGMTYNDGDSTITVYSTLTEPFYSTKAYRTVFISRLDNSLVETSPVTLLKSQFKNNTIANYLFVDNQEPQWICMLAKINIRRVFRRTNYIVPYNITDATDIPLNLVLPDPATTDSYQRDYSLPGNIRFTRLDSQFRILADSVVLNTKTQFYIEPYKFARFAIKDKRYLLMVQHFRGKRQGLLMMYLNDTKRFTTEDIRVYDKYEYLLPQLQPNTDQSVILPYINGREAGLLKITMD